jgi:DNA-binding transcriptional ArsR family regulator
MIVPVILARFDTETLTRLRFAISPSLELIRSTRVLDDPAAAALHLPWVERARERLGDLDLEPLRALQSSPTYNPDFVHPPPSGPLAEFEDDLAVMVATPDEQLSEEVRHAYHGHPLPPVLQPFIDEPRGAVERLADLMREYWRRCLEEDWPRIRALLEHDVLYRARQIADGGTRRLFCDLDPSVSWDEGELRVEGHCDGDLVLDERGLLLVPSVFVWPKVTAVSAAPWQPTLIYPARGIGMLWDEQRTTAPDALERLLGRTRAALLVSLDSPRSTTELAGALGLTAGGVSQHLSVLRDAGLVCGRRVTRSVLYLRSAEGDALVEAAGGAADAEEPQGAGPLRVAAV